MIVTLPVAAFILVFVILPFWIFICANLKFDKVVYGRDPPFFD